MLILAIFYIVFPYDFIPDMLGRVGRIDDILVILLVLYVYFFRPLVQELTAFFQKNVYADAPGNGRNGASADPAEKAFQTLNLKPDAGIVEVKKAYYEMVKQYHPDKLDGMGPELQKLALEKTREINEAYELLCQKLSR